MRCRENGTWFQRMFFTVDRTAEGQNRAVANSAFVTPRGRDGYLAIPGDGSNKYEEALQKKLKSAPLGSTKTIKLSPTDAGKVVAEIAERVPPRNEGLSKFYAIHISNIALTTDDEDWKSFTLELKQCCSKLNVFVAIITCVIEVPFVAALALAIINYANVISNLGSSFGGTNNLDKIYQLLCVNGGDDKSAIACLKDNNATIPSGSCALNIINGIFSNFDAMGCCTENPKPQFNEDFLKQCMSDQAPSPIETILEAALLVGAIVLIPIVMTCLLRSKCFKNTQNISIPKQRDGGASTLDTGGGR